MNLEALFAAMWADYTTTTPTAQTIHDQFVAKNGGPICNDHVALRTYDTIGIPALAAAFEGFGYKAKGEYHFELKKLYAQHFEKEGVASSGLPWPKVFISELLTQKFSDDFQKITGELCTQLSDEQKAATDLCISGRPWKIGQAQYQQLKKESEYGSWVAAYGHRVNHFTILVNKLGFTQSLESINEFVESNGHRLNESGGKIKGRKEIGLEQSSTLAYNHTVEFSDGSLEIPSCYYEFALRHNKDGSLYQGFVSQSADKIFESTDQGQ